MSEQWRVSSAAPEEPETQPGAEGQTQVAQEPSPAAAGPEASPRPTRMPAGANSWAAWVQQQVFPMLVAFLLGLSIGYIVWGQRSGASIIRGEDTSIAQNTGASANQPAAPAVPQATPTLPRLEVSEDDDPALGPEDAPVVIIEFGDYECPFCKRWRQTVFDPMMRDYGDKIRLVYRDFPLTSIHPQAVPAAIAANCAGEQGKYWEFHDLLFLGELPLGQEAYLEYARRLNLDMEAFQTCIKDEDGRQEAEIRKDFQDGLRLGVQGTPTFFINGVPVVGAQPYEVFRTIIERELSLATE